MDHARMAAAVPMLLEACHMILTFKSRRRQALPSYADLFHVSGRNVALLRLCPTTSSCPKIQAVAQKVRWLAIVSFFVLGII
jgi:hypothetical protein